MSPSRPSPRRSLKVNHWFTAAAVFAGVLLGAHFGDAVAPQSALAQPGRSGEPPAPFNPAGDRKMLIDALAEANARLGRIEAKLNTGISVKVTEMPAVKPTP